MIQMMSIHQCALLVFLHLFLFLFLEGGRFDVHNHYILHLLLRILN